MNSPYDSICKTPTSTNRTKSQHGKRMEKGHKVSFLTKNLLATDTSWERKISVLYSAVILGISTTFKGFIGQHKTDSLFFVDFLFWFGFCLFWRFNFWGFLGRVVLFFEREREIGNEVGWVGGWKESRTTWGKWKNMTKTRYIKQI